MTIAVALAGRLGPNFMLDFAFEVPVSGVTALLGPSGSGKTSLLRAIAGLDRHSGIVRVGSETWQDETLFVPPHRRRVGYAFQGTGLLAHLSVRDNLDFAGRRAGGDKRATEELVERLQLGDLLDRLPARLSGGEAQRASIARALAGRPRLLLLDEPLSGLDAAARALMLGRLDEMCHAIDIPVIHVTHDEAEARRLASRAVRLYRGRVERIEAWAAG